MSVSCEREGDSKIEIKKRERQIETEKNSFVGRYFY